MGDLKKYGVIALVVLAVIFVVNNVPVVGNLVRPRFTGAK